MAQDEKCVICDEAVTNPVCPNCLEKQVMYWIREKNSNLISVLRRIGESVMEYTHYNTSCVICGRNMNVCPHCYCNEIYTWLLENNHKELVESFLVHFNFELDYKFEMKSPAEFHRETVEIG